MHKFSMDQKKQLLMFITGSDRVPIGGLAKLKLVIARQGPDSNRYSQGYHIRSTILFFGSSRNL